MQLAEWLEQTGTTITAFAAAVGVDTSTAHNWMTRRRTPRLETAIEIERVTKGKVRPADFASEIAG